MKNLADANINLNPDIFMRRMLRDLTGLLQDVVGLEQAEGYIHSVGASVGEWIEAQYRAELGRVDMDPHQVAEVFVDLKRRIGGDFYVLSVDNDKIVVGNRRCPFGEMAQGRDALCMMTSNVFGRIASDHLGYARVDLEETIARGDSGCRITVHLTPSVEVEPNAREYYRVEAAE